MDTNRENHGLTEFEIFWKKYPKKVAKGDARKAWNQTSSIRPDLAQLLINLEEQCQCDQWRKDGGQFIPHMSTWLRGERWEDCLTIEIAKPVRAPDVFDRANAKFAAAQAVITPEERARVAARFATLKAMP